MIFNGAPFVSVAVKSRKPDRPSSPVIRAPAHDEETSERAGDNRAVTGSDRSCVLPLPGRDIFICLSSHSTDNGRPTLVNGQRMKISMRATNAGRRAAARYGVVPIAAARPEDAAMPTVSPARICRQSGASSAQHTDLVITNPKRATLLYGEGRVMLATVVCADGHTGVLRGADLRGLHDRLQRGAREHYRRRCLRSCGRSLWLGGELGVAEGVRRPQLPRVQQQQRGSGLRRRELSEGETDSTAFVEGPSCAKVAFSGHLPRLPALCSWQTTLDATLQVLVNTPGLLLGLVLGFAALAKVAAAAASRAAWACRSSVLSIQAPPPAAALMAEPAAKAAGPGVCLQPAE